MFVNDIGSRWSRLAPHHRRAQREAVVIDSLDRVIQRIFTAGLLLHVVGAAGAGDISDGALAAAVAELDAALCDIRTTQFGSKVQPAVGDIGDVTGVSGHRHVPRRRSRFGRGPVGAVCR